MWLFKRRPKHISLESLSEYLDGGLSDADVQKVEDHLRTCESCSEELESLRGTVGLLRQTPVIPTRRDFTFAEAPESASDVREPVTSVGFPGLRVPVWAYGAAASVAVVAFAVTLSIDVTRGPDDGGGSGLFSQESGDSFSTTLADPEDRPIHTPIPPMTGAPLPQMEEQELQEATEPTALPMFEATTSMPEPTPMTEMAMIEPTPAPTQTPQPAFSMGKADTEDSEPDMVMSRAVEPTSGAKAERTDVPTSAPPPGDAAETQAAGLTYRPTAVPAPKPTSAPQPTDTPMPKLTATPQSTATPTPRPTPTPSPTSTPTPLPTSAQAPPVAPDIGLDPRAAGESTDITTDEIARMRESLGTDRGISAWWIVEGVLAALALGLVVVLALRLHARRRKAS